MKVTKRQLRRIIAEERQKLVTESVTDMSALEDSVQDAAMLISAELRPELCRYPQGEMDPGDISTTWPQEVGAASFALETDIEAAIKEVIQKIEAQLHDGAFYRS